MAKLRRLLGRAALLICLRVVLVRELHDRNERIVRESSVDFSKLSNNVTLRLLAKTSRSFNGIRFDARYSIVKHLKDGGQGAVYLCLDGGAPHRERVVVKIISATSRNMIPDQLRAIFGNVTNTWPSELDASLSIDATFGGEGSSYVPIHDHFILWNIDGKLDSWAWTIVTRFMSGGIITGLGAALAVYRKDC